VVSAATAPTMQLLAWIAEQPRTYAETLEVWRTSCPRLAVWEDALADGLVRAERGRVVLTGRGEELLDLAGTPAVHGSRPAPGAPLNATKEQPCT
jgi:hypothetical protein